jgi:hypothetical protein
MRDEICRAFCNEISVKEVPAGLAISTAFRRPDGDAIGFYVVRTGLKGFGRIEDDGETIPYLEACGVDFETQTRRRAFDALLAEYGAEYDSEENLIHTPQVREDELPLAALHFVPLLLRMYDFLLLTQEHVESTFKEDASKSIRDSVGTRAQITEGEAVNSKLSEIIPDLVLRAPNRDPVAVFLSQSATRVYEAVILQMAALSEVREPLAVVALLEKESTLSQNVHRLARNRLAAVTTWEGDKDAAISRIAREVIGTDVVLH